MEAPSKLPETHVDSLTYHSDEPLRPEPEAPRPELRAAEPIRPELLRPTEEVAPGGRRRRRRWAPEEKQAATLQAYEMRQAGRRWSEVASELNVLEGSLRKWLEDFENANHAVRPASAAARALNGLNPEGGTVAVTTPDGFRVEGLSIDDAHLLIEMLRAEAEVDEDDVDVDADEE